MSDTDYPEGTTAVCIHCRQKILLDQREGGGPGKDWGSTPDQWVGNGGIGMDYGCGDNPNSGLDGTDSHEPDPDTIKEPDYTVTDIIIKLHIGDTHPWANPATRPNVFNVQSEEDDEIAFVTVAREGEQHPTKGFITYQGSVD